MRGMYLHRDLALLVNPVETSTQGDFGLVQLFLRAFKEKVFLVVCLNVRILECISNFVMSFLVWKP